MAGNFWGDTIRTLRREQKISQRQLSVGAKVNRSTLRRIEEGPGSGDIDTIERLFNYLGYELDVLASMTQEQRLKKQHQAPADDPNKVSKAAKNRLLGLSAIGV